MVAIVVLTSFPQSALAVLLVDVKANGQDSLTLATSTESFVITLDSTDATACQMTAPVLSGFTIGGSVTVNPGDVLYPIAGGSTTFTITCADVAGGTLSDNVTVSLPAVVPPALPTIDVKANGSDGPVTLNSGDTYTYTWNSTNATACEQTSPVTSGITLNGASATIALGDSFYPSTTTPVTITVSCTNGTDNATDSVVVNLAASTTTPPVVPPTPPSGGGGGRGGRGGRAATPVLPLQCPLIKDYMRIDFANDPIEVMKLQAFLKVFEGHDYVTINGTFDQATYQAVGAFQEKYRGDVLTPWGHTEATHYVYILTQKKINEIYCQTVYQLTQDQLNEIDAFRALYQNIGNSPDLPIVGVIDNDDTESTPLPIVGSEDKGQIRQFAAAVLSFPETLRDKMQCLYEVVLIIFVLYILGSILADVLYKKDIDKPYRRFGYKWFAIVVGLIAAIAIAFLLGEFCLLLPLLIALLLSVVWIAMYPKHEKVKSGARNLHNKVKTKMSSYRKSNTGSSVMNLPGAVEIKDEDEFDPR